MIPIATSSEIKALDDMTRAGNLDNGFKLMQQASRLLFDLIIAKILELNKEGVESTILILCGKGNNGGDGLLLASHLVEEGYPVKCFLFAEASELEAEAQMALDALNKTKKNAFTQIKDQSDLVMLKDFMNNLTGSPFHAVVVDALYGVGYKSTEPNPILAEAAQIINSSPKEKSILAVDGPSGIDNDSGSFLQAPIKADNSLALGFPKLGNFFYPARAFLGLLMFGNLDYKHKDIDACLKSKLYFVDKIKGFLPGRAMNGSKYQHGCVSNIAGSESMSGAALLSTKAIYKSGAGMAYLYSSCDTDFSLACPEIIASKIDSNSAKEILANPKINCISIGPGLGADHKKLIYKLVEDSTKPLVLDADAINAFVDNHDKLKKHKADLVITPHLGEYKRLFPDDLNSSMAPLSIIDSIKKRSKEFNMTILLKGSPTMIADPSGEVFVVPYGNSALATAGSGDVLTGLIAGFCAQSYVRRNQFLTNSSLITQNSILAAYLHGKTAELISPELSEYSVMASDVLNNIHRAIKMSTS